MGEDRAGGYMSWRAGEGTDYAIKKSYSIVMSDNQMALSGLNQGAVAPPASFSQIFRESMTRGDAPIKRLGSKGGPSCAKGSIDFTRSFGLEQRKGNQHLQSADLLDIFSPVQRERQEWQPSLPDAFGVGDFTELVPCEIAELENNPNRERLTKLFPKISGSSILEVRPSEATGQVRKALKIGLVLSGGPAPGGHNVIAGVFDAVKLGNQEGQVFGFLGGLDGLMDKRYRVVDGEIMKRFRNSGGFDMLWSGRGKITCEADKQKALTTCEALELNGLVIVGGDGSNSNAALLAEYFAAHLPSCSVIGVPKTIDGDLKNAAIEVSFGFDTATKTYSELIGNLCVDVCSGQSVYHFVRVMGRSASHLALECALQTRANLVFIGEEVEQNSTTLAEIVQDLVDLVVERYQLGKAYGIVLVPEGLIEFIPEMKQLIAELNKMLLGGDANCFDPSNLTPDSHKLWDFLPNTIRQQLLGDRESTGYIQVAKIAFEKLLIALLEAELQRIAEIDLDEIVTMPHYFGYEGRCAMPSNFDANYCYALGFTATALIEHEKNGFMAVVRHLDQDPSMWCPTGVPFPKLMEIIEGAHGEPYPAVKKQLVDVNGPLFKVFSEVRKMWRTQDVYRCPGPIQFESDCEAPCYSISHPSASELLLGGNRKRTDPARCMVSKWLGSLSPLQQRRLLHRPAIPPICLDKTAFCVEGNVHYPKDPYTQRQILLFYPYLCNSNHFKLRDVAHSPDIPPISGKLRIGVVVLSRQSPGMMNVIWGLHERSKLVGGELIGLFGMEGLRDGKHIVISDEDIAPYCNLGGIEMLGRSQRHLLLNSDERVRAKKTCAQLGLDSLIIVGSSLAMTEATLLAEYFLTENFHCGVIGVPATGSNNLVHELIETNIGFDTSSKVYSSLIGNVLTDAASMPKYWHFIRLMGRQPSNEVLECALQTHPNIVIIAEEYGAAQKTLADVVNDISDVICSRADEGKNFGTVLIPDGLLSHLPNMRMLMVEISGMLKEAAAENDVKELQRQLLHDEEEALLVSNSPIAVESNNDISITHGKSKLMSSDGGGSSNNSTCQSSNNKWLNKMTPWSHALFKSLPIFIRKELLLHSDSTGERKDSLLETEVLLSIMVKDELAKRAEANLYRGKFQFVTHFFGYQGRSAMPSQFDCQLGFAYGHLAAICAESGLTGHCCTIRGLCGEVHDWRLSAIPFNCLLTMVPTQQDMQMHPALVHSRASSKAMDMPIVPNAEVSLQCKAFRWLKWSEERWEQQDRFCNPGPIQFAGSAAKFYHRILHEEQAEYFNMLKNCEKYVKILQECCNFGVEEDFLKMAYVSLSGLLSVRFNLIDQLPNFDISDRKNVIQSRRRHVEQKGSKIGLFGPSAPSGGLTRQMTTNIQERLRVGSAITQTAAAGTAGLLHGGGGSSSVAGLFKRAADERGLDHGWGIGHDVGELLPEGDTEDEPETSNAATPSSSPVGVHTS